MTFPYVHTVPRAPGSPARWDREPWASAPAIEIAEVMGSRPEHRPRTRARLLWDEEALYVAFQVQDRWVLGVQPDAATVCRDSCVELFFSPGEVTDTGYFNIECGCQGLVLFRHQEGRGRGAVTLPVSSVSALGARTTLPSRVWPEVDEPLEWAAFYRIPYRVLDPWGPSTPPSTGSVWRANLYKCADGSSHPHWLTWSPVDRATPDFHRPEYFGYLVFV